MLVLGAGLAIGSLVPWTSSEPAAQAASPTRDEQDARPATLGPVFRNGKAGFIVTDISFALGPDAKESGACPSGLYSGVRGLMEAYAKGPAGARRADEADQAYQSRVGLAIHTAPNGQNLCLHPESGSPDPAWRMVTGRNLKVQGIDLDAIKPAKRPDNGTCSHEEFLGTNGERGIDNQFYRVIGCTTGFQSDGAANSFKIEMETGSWGILFSLSGVDDLRNDSDIEVGIFASADPIALSADRKALSYATYSVDQDPRYRSTTRGRITNGVLTIDPVDVRFHDVVNGMYGDRALRDARVHLTFTPDGGMEGYLAGYAPLESMYDLQFGSRDYRLNGKLAPERLRAGTAMGRAGAVGHTCNGAYFALKQAADGHRDPATGRCTSISTQYRIRVMPAFVVDVPTSSLNAPLIQR